MPPEARTTREVLSLAAPTALPGDACDPDLATAMHALWEKAETYHERNVAELSQLRVEALSGTRARAGGPARSADVSARDAAAMVGLCDHLSLLTLQQRAALGALLSDRAQLAAGLGALDHLAEAATSGDAAACPRQQSLRGAIRRQAHGLNQAIESLEQLRMLTDAVAAARPGSGQLDEERSNPLVTPIEGSVCSSAAAACSQAAEALRRARSALERLAPFLLRYLGKSVLASASCRLFPNMRLTMQMYILYMITNLLNS